MNVARVNATEATARTIRRVRVALVVSAIVAVISPPRPGLLSDVTPVALSRTGISGPAHIGADGAMLSV
jgi:hypothetical protein